MGKRIGKKAAMVAALEAALPLVLAHGMGTEDVERSRGACSCRHCLTAEQIVDALKLASKASPPKPRALDLDLPEARDAQFDGKGDELPVASAAAQRVEADVLEAAQVAHQVAPSEQIGDAPDWHREALEFHELEGPEFARELGNLPPADELDASFGAVIRLVAGLEAAITDLELPTNLLEDEPRRVAAFEAVDRARLPLAETINLLRQARAIAAGRLTPAQAAEVFRVEA